MNARGSLLYQDRPNGSGVIAFVATINTEITRIQAHNAGATASVDVDIFHDETGVATIGGANQIARLVVTNAGEGRTRSLEAQTANGGITIGRDGRLALTCTDADVTVSVYGVSARIAEPDPDRRR